jgi:hypothetical protein
MLIQPCKRLDALKLSEGMMKIAGTILLLVGMSGFAFAGTGVPEIDPATGVSALALLSGGLLVIRARQRRN